MHGRNELEEKTTSKLLIFLKLVGRAFPGPSYARHRMVHFSMSLVSSLLTTGLARFGSCLCNGVKSIQQSPTKAFLQHRLDCGESSYLPRIGVFDILFVALCSL